MYEIAIMPNFPMYFKKPNLKKILLFMLIPFLILLPITIIFSIINVNSTYAVGLITLEAIILFCMPFVLVGFYLTTVKMDLLEDRAIYKNFIKGKKEIMYTNIKSIGFGKFIDYRYVQNVLTFKLNDGQDDIAINMSLFNMKEMNTIIKTIISKCPNSMVGENVIHILQGNLVGWKALKSLGGDSNYKPASEI